MPNTKTALKKFLNEATAEFLAKGGSIRIIPQGRRTV